MQTNIYYNDVSIVDILTDSITGEPVKDSTGVDQIGTRIVISGTGVVNTSPNFNLHGINISSLAGGINYLLARLTKDRRPLKIEIGGSTIIDIRPGAAEPNAPAGTITANLAEMDIEHGPKPHIEIRKIISGYSATIAFRFEVVIPNCGNDQGSGSGLINFRFWVGDDIDCKTWLTRRTYTGRIRVAHKHISTHALARAVVIPPLQRGFKRSAIQLHESSDGLTLDFTVTDDEVYAAAPWFTGENMGATDWRGSYAIVSNDGVTCETEFSVELTGPKSTPKTRLLELAFKVFLLKTHYLDINTEQNGSAYLSVFAAREQLHENKVEVTARITHYSELKFLMNLFALGPTNELGKYLPDMGIGYDPDVAFHPGPTATLTGLFLSLLQTTCNPRTMLQIVDQPPEKKPDTYQPEEGDEEQPQPAQTDLQQDGGAEQGSTSHAKSMYLKYDMQSRYVEDSGLAAFALGTASDSPDRSVAIVTMHQPTAKREITIDAVRVNANPELPKLRTNWNDANGIKHTQIGQAIINASPPELAADGRRNICRARMRIVYAMDRPPRENESVPIGKLAYRGEQASVGLQAIRAQDFVDPSKLLK